MKSWTFARIALLKGLEAPALFLCARELQSSIKDSVHKLLATQVEKMGLGAFYKVGKSYIRHRFHATEFIFAGLRHNVNEIKSMEGVKYCWVEEADSVSDRSWELLIPTIRAADSEIWASFNPNKESDPVYSRFVLNTPEDCLIKKVSWRDNKYFPAPLEAERRYCELYNPLSYDHIWEGACRDITESGILSGMLEIDAFSPSPDWSGPYYGADWGFSVDPTALVRCWLHDNILYVDQEAYGLNVAIQDTPDLFATVPGAARHVIRADSSRPELINYMQSNGYPQCTSVSKWQGSVEDGIEFLRGLKSIVVHQRCKHVIDEMRSWSFKVDRKTGDILPIPLDSNNHTIDAIRYAIAPIIRQRSTVYAGTSK